MRRKPASRQHSFGQCPLKSLQASKAFGVFAAGGQAAKSRLDLDQFDHVSMREFAHGLDLALMALEHPALGKSFSDRSALWLWDEKPRHWKAAPMLGEDNHYVFVELLGHSELELKSFVEKGIIN